ncbi:hypothetical protein NOZE110980_20365 [Nocardioides zeicaulis]
MTVQDATEVTVRLKQGKDSTVKRLDADGGAIRLPGSLRKGALQLKVVATGDGGRRTLTRTIVVR